MLDLVASGLDNHTIARRLVLNPKTVRNHVSNILAKVSAADRAQAVSVRAFGRVGDGQRRSRPASRSGWGSC